MFGSACTAAFFTLAAFFALAAPGSEQLATPPPDTVRAATREILADPRFAPQTSLWQWFASLFRDWDFSGFGSLGAFGTVLVWIIFIWGAITLVAILAHIGWTILAVASSRTRSDELSSLHEGLSIEELQRRIQSFAAEGAFTNALAAMMAVLLLRLQHAGYVDVHESKTNGDYLREVPPEARIRDTFGCFVQRFDVLVYDAAGCSRSDFEGMDALYEEIVGSVSEQS